MVNRVCTTLKEQASWDSKTNETRTLVHYADVWIALSYFILYFDAVYLKKKRSLTNCIVSIHCAPMKSCIQTTQFVLSTWLVVQDHSVRSYVAKSIIGPVKAGIMFVLLLWQPKFIHYLEHLVVMNSLCGICLLAVETKHSTHYELRFWQWFEYLWKVYLITVALWPFMPLPLL